VNEPQKNINILLTEKELRVDTFREHKETEILLSVINDENLLIYGVEGKNTNTAWKYYKLC
jgi:hypothetical protein